MAEALFLRGGDHLRHCSQTSGGQQLFDLGSVVLVKPASGQKHHVREEIPG